MWPKNFDYVRASSIDEALQQLSDADTKVLAGGHSLLPAMRLRLSAPGKLVDISQLPGMKDIMVTNGSISIGALATHTEIAQSADVQTHAPALAYGASIIGDQQVRNFGTIGGNIAHADPASDPPAILLAYGATIHVQGPNGARSIAADDFFTDLFETALESNEIITSVEIPSHAGVRSAYAKLKHPASRYALLGVAVSLAMDGGTCTDARVAVGGATPYAVRSSQAEAALAGSDLGAAALDAAASALTNELKDFVIGDIFAPVDYRSHMLGVYLKRAVDMALS